MAGIRATPGEGITARKWNALVAELATSIRGGQGLEVRRQGGYVVLSLREDPAPKVYPARIVAVLGPGQGVTPSALNLGYRVARVGLPDSAAIDIPPDRVVDRVNYTGDVALEPAPVGSFGLIREFRDGAGQSLPHFAVWKEAPAVTPACPESLRDGSLRDGVSAAGFFARQVELVVDDAANDNAPSPGDAQGPAGEATGMSMDERSETIELEDLGNEGWTGAVAVPAGATTCKAQLVANGDGTDPPLCELILGTSLAGHDPVYTGAAGILLPGEVGPAGRTAMSGVFSVEGDGYVHVEVRDPAHGTGLGKGVLHFLFGN